MREKINKKIKNILSHEWDKTTFHSLFLISLIFIFFLFASSFFFIGDKISREKYDIHLVKLPSAFERSINKLAGDYPIKTMIPYIVKKDKQVAAYLVAIAKKESNWGKYSPRKYGQECYNYWGYRGEYNRNASGYSCFNSPEQAVDVVGKRIKELIAEKIDTPGEMVVWKCGSECPDHDFSNVQKWISDVDFYYKEINGIRPNG